MTPAPNTGRRAASAHGFSYVEVLVAVLIMAVSLPAALEAIRGGLVVSRVEGQQTTRQARLKSRMEEILANRFATLDAAAVAAGNTPTAVLAAWSDAAGTTDRLVTNIYRYDGSAPAAGDTGLLWVKVSIEGSTLALNTLAAR